MKSLFPIPVALVLIMGTGLVHGLWSERWKLSAELDLAALRLGSVPTILGEWQSEERAVDPEVFARTGLTACWMRRYVNQHTGTEVVALLMCGRPGPTAVHTPEACYKGAGFSMAGSPVQTDLVDKATFWTARFTKKNAGISEHLRIFWAWSASGGWQAPRYPRLEFSRYQALYKLYVIHTLADPREPVENDPGKMFIRQNLAELTKYLFPSEAAVLPEPRWLIKPRECHARGD